MNLNFNYVIEFQKIRETDEAIKKYKEAINTGLLDIPKLKVSDLEHEIKIREKRISQIKSELDSFKVHQEYSEITKKADALTSELHNLVNDSSIQKSLLRRYEETVSKESVNISQTDIQRIYAEAGILFDKNFIKRLDEVLQFHSSIIDNRSQYLKTEIQRIKDNINDNDQKIKSLSHKRADIMKILSENGALEEYTLLQERYSNEYHLLENAKETLESKNKLLEEQNKLKYKLSELNQKADYDFNKNIGTYNEYKNIFLENTSHLYTDPGILKIDHNDNGYSFDIKIPSSNSQGINYMMIFCYDMLLAELGARKLKFPNFWVHDSKIFDGVDERQISSALELAKEKCDLFDLQYICMINSDSVPYDDFDDNFRSFFNENVILTLSDTNEGRLLGIQI